MRWLQLPGHTATSRLRENAVASQTLTEISTDDLRRSFNSFNQQVLVSHPATRQARASAFKKACLSRSKTALQTPFEKLTSSQWHEMLRTWEPPATSGGVGNYKHAITLNIHTRYLVLTESGVKDRDPRSQDWDGWGNLAAASGSGSVPLQGRGGTLREGEHLWPAETARKRDVQMGKAQECALSWRLPFKPISEKAP